MNKFMNSGIQPDEAQRSNSLSNIKIREDDKHLRGPKKCLLPKRHP